MITKFKLFESQKSNDKEYFDAVSIHYNDELVDYIKQGEQMACQMAHTRNITTEKTDSGNLLIRYIKTNQYLLILGAVAISGRMNREDITDMNKWINTAVDLLDDDIIIMTSPNELSEPLIKKVIKIAEKRGIELDIHKQDINMFQHDTLTWKHYVIRKI